MLKQSHLQQLQLFVLYEKTKLQKQKEIIIIIICMCVCDRTVSQLTHLSLRKPKWLTALQFIAFFCHWTYPGKYGFHLWVTRPGHWCVQKYLARLYVAGQGGACYKNTQVEARLQSLCCSFSRYHVIHSFCFCSFSSNFAAEDLPQNMTYKRNLVSANYFGLWWS